MNVARDGGPAFPRPPAIIAWSDETREFHEQQAGMALRDYFAGRAVGAVIAFEDRGLSQEDALPADVVARKAYEIADAMLAERAK